MLISGHQELSKKRARNYIVTDLHDERVLLGWVSKLVEVELE